MDTADRRLKNVVGVILILGIKENGKGEEKTG